jgi:uncharacterized protein (TIGR02284 family)
MLMETVITTNDKALAVLNSLIRAGRDSEQGFLAAADAVGEKELVEFFSHYAVQRAKFAAELEDRVRTLRAVPEKGGSLAGDVHRAWMGLKAAIASRETHAILEECERGEDMAVMAYRQALAERDVDKQTREVIQRQYEFVQAAHDRVRQLRDSATYAHR